MKIKRISVQGLFGRHDHTVNIFGGLTYVHSPNGCGKSTLIRMMSMLLTGNINDLANIPFQRMDVSFANGENLIVERSDLGLLIQMQRNELETEISAGELVSMTGTTFISSERTYVKRGDGHMVPAVEAYAHDISNRLKEARKQRTLTVPEYKDDMGDDKFISWAKDLNAKLSFMRDAGVTVDIPSGLKFPPTRYDLSESRKEYLDLVHGISGFVNRNHYLSESVIVFRDLINGFLCDKDMAIDGKGHISFVLENGTTLPVKDMSSGEKQIFIILYRLLFQTSPSSFVMIDEPEISLHISWQHRIGPLLKDIARLRDLQIVVATHSPQIVHDDWDLANELRAGCA
ncbi:MAG: AAA family ATPase [Methanomassiliicoccaceae archaeon]|jgi:ABC-type cobalamin/Fe3+-siderophores transport system ATPase subunit|nr:AAA family ATPase [Methanomassiliicoccaceae archaeon]